MSTTPIAPVSIINAPRRAAVERAHALFQAEDRHMDLFGAALSAPAPSSAGSVAPDASRIPAQHLADLARVAEGELLSTHQRLRTAQAQARQAATTDATLLALHQRLYNSPTSTSGQSGVNAAPHTNGQVIDVQAREVPPAATPADA